MIKNKKTKKSMSSNKKKVIEVKSMDSFYMDHKKNKWAENQSSISDDAIGYNPFFNFQIKRSPKI